MKIISLVFAAFFVTGVMAQIPSSTVDAAKSGAAAVQKNSATTPDAGKAGVAQKVLVNVNTASEADLQKVPGIGPEKAKAIIAGRPYAKIEDLTKVKGIKEGLLAKIKPYVTTK